MNIYYYTYKYTTDTDYNFGFKELTETFLGTEKDFKEYCEYQQKGWGFTWWDIKKRKATPEELINYKRYKALYKRYKDKFNKLHPEEQKKIRNSYLYSYQKLMEDVTKKYEVALNELRKIFFIPDDPAHR